MRAHLCLALLGCVTGAVLDHTSLDPSSAALNGATGEAYACKSGDCSNGLYWSNWDFENTELTMTVGQKIIFLFASEQGHDVHVAGSKDAFDSCNATTGTTVASSNVGGGTNIANQCTSPDGCRDKYEAVLTQPGTLYFICTHTLHCSQQKIKVTVNNAPPAPPALPPPSPSPLPSAPPPVPLSPPPPPPRSPSPPMADTFGAWTPYALVRPSVIGGQEASYSDLGGSLVVQADEGVLRVYGFLTGLRASTTGGWHIHTGYECGTSAKQGDHYCPDGDACIDDPWVGVTYTSDASGNAEIDLRIADFSLVDGMPVAGRALVIHDSDAEGNAPRIGCGIISPTTAQIAVIDTYPKYAGALSVKGLLALRPVGTGLEIKGSLIGVESSETAGATAPQHAAAGPCPPRKILSFTQLLSTLPPSPPLPPPPPHLPSPSHISPCRASRPHHAAIPHQAGTSTPATAVTPRPTTPARRWAATTLTRRVRTPGMRSRTPRPPAARRTSA